MYNLNFLIILTVVFSFCLSRILSLALNKRKNEYKQMKQEYELLEKKSIGLITENRNLEVSADEIIALYDITKDICKSLDENEMFNIFRDCLSKYIRVQDCMFLTPEADISQYQNYEVFPLKIKKNNMGYLLSRGIQGSDKEKFNILVQQFLLGVKRAFLYKKIQELTITDSLTQVFNRRYFALRFNEELERSKDFNYKLSFLMLDIDHFKGYNDHFGHLVGDTILREVADTIKENMRQIDFMGRYGGEEFAIVLTETDKEQARFAAERFRKAVESKEIKAYDENLKVTISIGIAVFPDDANDPQKLINKADQALYKAKESGRNRVCV